MVVRHFCTGLFTHCFFSHKQNLVDVHCVLSSKYSPYLCETEVATVVFYRQSNSLMTSDVVFYHSRFFNSCSRAVVASFVSPR